MSPEAKDNKPGKMHMSNSFYIGIRIVKTNAVALLPGLSDETPVFGKAWCG
jgi:hypothetical protein